MIKEGKQRLIITIDEEIYEAVWWKANKLNITKSQFVENAILKELDNLKLLEKITKKGIKK